MTAAEREAEVEDRLAAYRTRCRQHQAMPQIMIGLALPAEGESYPIVSIPEGLPLASVRDTLRELLQEVERQIASGKK